MRSFWLVVATLVLAAAGVGIFLANRSESTGPGRTARTGDAMGKGAVAPAPPPTDARESTSVRLGDLGRMIDLLREYRVNGDPKSAEAHRATIVSLLSDQWPRDEKSLTTRAQEVIGRTRNTFVSNVCGSRAEAEYYADLGMLVAAEMGHHEAQLARGCGLVQELFGRGLPPEHAGTTVTHAQCSAIGPVVHLAIHAPSFGKEDASRLLSSEWCQQCPHMARFVVERVSRRFPGVLTPAHLGLLRSSSDGALLMAVSVALIKAGHLDRVVTTILKRDDEVATGLIEGCVSALSLEESWQLLELLRAEYVDSRRRSVVFEVAVDSGYGSWGTRYMRERKGGVHGLASQLLDLDESAAEVKLAHMNVITAACVRLSMTGGKIPRSRDAESSAWRGDVEQRLARAALKSYQSRQGVSTGELWALGYVVEDPLRFAEVANQVLDLPGSRRAIYDVANGLGALWVRKVATDQNREQLYGVARKCLSAVKYPHHIVPIRDFIRTAKAVELLDDLERVVRERAQGGSKQWAATVKLLSELRAELN